MNRISTHPYFVTSVVFLLILVAGRFFLHWREDHFAYLLLLYLIITLGIRLDDISKQIGTSHDRPTQIPDDEDSIIGQLNDIKSSLASIDATLNKIHQATQETARNRAEWGNEWQNGNDQR